MMKTSENRAGLKENAIQLSFSHRFNKTKSMNEKRFKAKLRKKIECKRRFES